MVKSFLKPSQKAATFSCCQHFAVIWSSRSGSFMWLLWKPIISFKSSFLHTAARGLSDSHWSLPEKKGKWHWQRNPFVVQWSVSVSFPYHPGLFDQGQTSTFRWDTECCQQHDQSPVLIHYSHTEIETFFSFELHPRDLRLYNINPILPSPPLSSAPFAKTDLQKQYAVR